MLLAALFLVHVSQPDPVSATAIRFVLAANTQALEDSVQRVHTSLGSSRAIRQRTTAVIQAQTPFGSVNVWGGSGRGLDDLQLAAIAREGGIAAPNLPGDAECRRRSKTEQFRR